MSKWEGRLWGFFSAATLAVTMAYVASIDSRVRSIESILMSKPYVVVSSK